MASQVIKGNMLFFSVESFEMLNFREQSFFSVDLLLVPLQQLLSIWGKALLCATGAFKSINKS